MSVFTRDHLLRPRGLEAPDGRPLCRYQLHDAELDELIALLRRRAPGDPSIAAEFCVAAAELWRRSYDGGLWTWDVVLPALGWRTDAPTVAPLVRSGLRYWRRPLLELQRREFLGSIAREAGIPIPILKQEGGAIRAFLRTHLGDLQTFGTANAVELARRVSRGLPERLQNPTFLQLASDLAVAAQGIGNELAQRVGPGVPITTHLLDSGVEGWRERLPVRLDEEATINLVMGLVDEARTTAPKRFIRVRTELYESHGGSFTVRRALELPGRIAVRELAEELAVAADAMPSRIDLLRLRDEGVVLVALLVRDGDAFRVELLRDVHPRVDESVRLVLRAQGAILGEVSLPGGGPLSELPWVFAARDTEGAPRKLVAQGSGSFVGHAIVGLPEGFVATPPGENVGECEARHLVRIVETTRFESGDAVVVVRAGLAPRDEVYTWRGSEFHGASRFIAWLGEPTLERRVAGGLVETVPKDRLLVRVGRSWLPFSGRRYGRTRLRVVDERGSVVHEESLDLLPAGFRVELSAVSPSKARLAVSRVDGARVGVLPPAGLAVTDLADDTWELEEPTTRVGAFKLALQWRDCRAEVPLPLPRTGYRFLASSGEVLPSGHRVALDSLHTVIIEAWSQRTSARAQFTLEARLQAHDSNREWNDIATLRVDRNGRYVLPLYAVERQLSRLLALSSDAAAEIELRVQGELGGYPSAAKLIVGRFSETLSIDRERGLAIVAAELDARALYIAAPERAVDLTRTAEGAFDLAPITGESGSWMIFGMRDGLPATTPKLMLVPGCEPKEGLAGAVDLARFEDRRRSFAACWDRMASEPGAVDWSLADQYFQQLDTFPATTFEALRALPECPAALALALLRTTEPAMLIRAFEAMPFHWATLPVQALRDAITRFRAFMAALVGDDELGARLAAESWRRVGAALCDRYSGFRVACASVAEDGATWLDGAFQYPVRHAPTDRLFEQVREAVKGLRQRQCDREFRPAYRALEPLFESLKTDRRELEVFACRDLPEDERPLVLAPLVAAYCSTANRTPTPLQAFTLRLAEAVDPDYFGEAYIAAMTIMLQREFVPTPPPTHTTRRTTRPNIAAVPTTILRKRPQ